MAVKKLPIVAIVGRANVGKSSLFNAILNRRETIVAREAGTTRDSISARASHEGRDFWLVDTAGVKDPEDDFEFTIQEQITQAADSADVIWVVIEATTLITEEDRKVATLALKSKKPVILVVNKADKAPRALVEDYMRLGIKNIVLTSAPQKKGLTELLDLLVKEIPKVSIKKASNVLNIAILGRPNVGKSSLFNVLAKKQQALVADVAGTTRDVNRINVRYKQRDVQILDTAGIRRSGKIKVGVERFSVIRALSAIEQSDICLLLIDANEPNTQLDQKIAGLIKEAGKGLVIVVSKWDSVEGKTPYTRDQMAGMIAKDYQFVAWAPLIFTSSVTGQNITKIFDLAMEIEVKRRQKILTKELNKWLKRVTSLHPPAGLKNHQPKLKYMVQEIENVMPSFKIFGTHTKFLHWSYKRYLEKSLRETYDFTGTPVKFWFTDD